MATKNEYHSQKLYALVKSVLTTSRRKSTSFPTSLMSGLHCNSFVCYEQLPFPVRIKHHFIYTLSGVKNTQWEREHLNLDSHEALKRYFLFFSPEFDCSQRGCGTCVKSGKLIFHSLFLSKEVDIYSSWLNTYLVPMIDCLKFGKKKRKKILT